VKLTMPRDTLAAMTAWATAAASLGLPDGITPVLAGIMLTATADGHLTAGRFGYEASATARAAAEVGEPGRVLVSARMLTQVTAALPAGTPAEVAFDGTRVTLEAGGFRYALMALPPGEYPELPAEPPEHAAEFDPADLAAAVGIAATATAPPADALPRLTCVHVALDGEGTATLTATDRYRLAVLTCPYTAGPADAPGTALIPARELSAALKRGGAAPVRLDITTGAASLASDGRHVTIRQLGEEFPNVTRLIPDPKDATTTAVADVAALSAALKRAAVVVDGDTPARFHFDGDGVRVESGAGDEATLTATVPLAIDGAPLAIAFKPRYLLDALAAITATGAAAAAIAMTEPGKAAVITPAGQGGAIGCTYAVMPVRQAG
jgi:DNA polymerase-3 subunit beta